MSSVIHKQANFTKGEIDERLLARTDLDIFEKGAKRIRNLLVLPQGGLNRRFGTEYVDALAIATTASEVRIVMLEYEDETKYLLVFEPASLKIYHQDALVSTEVSPYTAAQLPDVKFTQGINTLVSTHEEVQPYELTRTAAHGGWTYAVITFSWYPTYDFDRNYDAATFTPTAVTGNITLNATGNPFKAAHVNGLFFGNEGTLRITTFVNANQVTGFTVNDFKNTNTINGNLAILTEPAWSATLGWPRCTTFFQDRLCFGGSKTLPQAIWMSKTNQYNDFDDSEALASSAIGVFINTDNSNIVEDILGYTTFIVFTSTGVLNMPFIDDSPITPTNISFHQQARNGIGNIDPLIFDNAVQYVDRGGKVIWSLRYDVQRAGYVFNDISIISQSLIRNPVATAFYKNYAIDEGDHYIVVNSDGTLAILTRIEDQEVSAWTLSETDGEFRQIAASDETVYFIVEREINSVTKFYIEKLTFDVLVDSASVQTLGAPATVVTGLDHLEAKTVKVIGDGYNMNDQVVSGGEITIETPRTNLQIGLNYEPLVVPLPINVQLSTGSNFYMNKRIKTIWVDYFESLGIYIDDHEIPSEVFGVSQMDEVATPATGVYEYTLMKGWDSRTEIEIKQLEPLPMTLRGLGFLVEINENG